MDSIKDQKILKVIHNAKILKKKLWRNFYSKCKENVQNSEIVSRSEQKLMRQKQLLQFRIESIIKWLAKVINLAGYMEINNMQSYEDIETSRLDTKEHRASQKW